MSLSGVAPHQGKNASAPEKRERKKNRKREKRVNESSVETLSKPNQNENKHSEKKRSKCTHTSTNSQCVECMEEEKKTIQCRINVFLSLRSSLLHFVSVAFFFLLSGTHGMALMRFVCLLLCSIYHILQVEKFSIRELGLRVSI